MKGLKKLLRSLGITHNCTTVYNPSINSVNGRVIKVLKEELVVTCTENTQLLSAMKIIQSYFYYRVLPKAMTYVSQLYLLNVLQHLQSEKVSPDIAKFVNAVTGIC